MDDEMTMKVTKLGAEKTQSGSLCSFYSTCIALCHPPNSSRILFPLSLKMAMSSTRATLTRRRKSLLPRSGPNKDMRGGRIYQAAKSPNGVDDGRGRPDFMCKKNWYKIGNRAHARRCDDSPRSPRTQSTLHCAKPSVVTPRSMGEIHFSCLLGCLTNVLAGTC